MSINEFFEKNFDFSPTVVNFKQTDEKLEVTIRLKEVISYSDFFSFNQETFKFLQNAGAPKNTKLIFTYETYSKLDVHFLSYFQAQIKSFNTNDPVNKRFLEVVSKSEFKVDETNKTIDITVDANTLNWAIKHNLSKALFNAFSNYFGLPFIFNFKKRPVSKTTFELNTQSENVQTGSNQAYTQTVRSNQGYSRRRSYSFRDDLSLKKLKEIPYDNYEVTKKQNQGESLVYKFHVTVVETEIRKLKDGKYTLLQMTLEDETDAILAKKFLYNQEITEAEKIQPGTNLKIIAEVQYDTYAADVVLMLKNFEIVDKENEDQENALFTRQDKAENKRVELHVQTKLSNMDGVGEIKDYVALAKSFGHKAIAVTDSGGIYAYPQFAQACKKAEIKPIYGVQMPYIDDSFYIKKGDSDTLLKDLTYVVFDLETTGLSIVNDKIIEIGAVKVKNGQIIDRFQAFCDPEEKLIEFVSNLTNITDEMLKGQPKIEVVLKDFIEFAKDSVLVAHNASFDCLNVLYKAKVLNYSFGENVLYIDTLNLARYHYSDQLKRFNLGTLSRFFKINLENHHRAIDDADATGQMFIKMLEDLAQKNIKTFNELETTVDRSKTYLHQMPFAVDFLVKNQTGYKNLFKLVTSALTEYFHQRPRVLESEFEKYKEGLLIGANGAGELWFDALNSTDDVLDSHILKYDYVLVYPPSCFSHLKDNISGGMEAIKNAISRLILHAKKLNKTVVASSNPHYLNKEDQIYYQFFIRTPLVGGGRHELAQYETTPDYFFQTTDELSAEFAFLNDDKLIKEIVVGNSNQIADLIQDIQAFPEGLYSFSDDYFKDQGIPSIEGEFKRLISKNLEQKYGKNPHPFILDRVKREQTTILKNNFASIYYMSYLLVKKSNDDGYVVGSRGSVGSSFVATILGITEVNPLPPHYFCPKGCFQVFKFNEDLKKDYASTQFDEMFKDDLNEADDGYDLKERDCPVCGAKLNRDGHDIPFETFLGFQGDKTPDIDLNFSGEYQAQAHEYVRTLLGADHAFRAGTVSGVAEKIAFGYVKGYIEDKQMKIRKPKIAALAKKIVGVKRTTGQHPGGIVVVPKPYSIFDVTPVQFPSDDTSASWRTTHFDYHSFEENLLKLDILGHDDPTMIKFLFDYVKANPTEFPFSEVRDIPMADVDVYKMFSGNEILNVDYSNAPFMPATASTALPEFGTPFVSQILAETKPTTFAELVKISGLSHGENVWLNNGKVLKDGHPEFGSIPFKNLIGCRDDIMITLISKYNVEPLLAFNAMEFIRKGNCRRNPAKWAEYANQLRVFGVPEWYIYSCGLINYMFPKAHATAYVIMAIRIAWFKLHKPLLFYSAFFSKRAVQFDYTVMTSGKIAIGNKIRELEQLGYEIKAKDQELLVTLKVAYEFCARGFSFSKLAVNESSAKTFNIKGNTLQMPFATIDGTGDAAAFDSVNARKDGLYTSKEDFKARSGVNKTVYKKFLDLGCLDDLPDK